MPVFRRKPNIRKLAMQLEAVEHDLRALFDNSKCVSSPTDMQTLAYIRRKLNDLPKLAEDTEKECWRRIDEYINTPYTPGQLLWRKVLAFIGWWVLATITLAQSILGWVVSWFPTPWHMFATSAAISFVIILMVLKAECKRTKE